MRRQPVRLFLDIFSLPCGDVLLRASVLSVPLFPPPVGDQRVRVAGGRPSVQTSSIETWARKVNDRDLEQGTCLTGSRLTASKGMFVVLTACTHCVGYDRHVDGWMLKLVLPDWSSKCRPTDPRKPAKNVGLQEKLNAERKVFVRLDFWEAELDLLFEATWFWRSRDRRFRSTCTEKDYEFRGPVGPKACRSTALPYAHGRLDLTVRTHGQTLLFYRYR